MGSIPTLTAICGCSSVVERHLAKVEAVGSNPITRSIITLGRRIMDDFSPSLWVITVAERFIDRFAGDRLWVSLGVMPYRQPHLEIHCAYCASNPEPALNTSLPSGIVIPNQALRTLTLTLFSTERHHVPADVWLGICKGCNTMHHAM